MSRLRVTDCRTPAASRTVLSTGWISRLTLMPFDATAAEIESTKNGMSSLFIAIRIARRPCASLKLSSATAGLPDFRECASASVKRAASSQALASNPSFSPGSALSKKADAIAFIKALSIFVDDFDALAAAINILLNPRRPSIAHIIYGANHCNFISTLMPMLAARHK